METEHKVVLVPMLSTEEFKTSQPNFTAPVTGTYSFGCCDSAPHLLKAGESHICSNNNEVKK